MIFFDTSHTDADLNPSSSISTATSGHRPPSLSRPSVRTRRHHTSPTDFQERVDTPPAKHESTPRSLVCIRFQLAHTARRPLFGALSSPAGDAPNRAVAHSGCTRSSGDLPVSDGAAAGGRLAPHVASRRHLPLPRLLEYTSGRRK